MRTGNRHSNHAHTHHLPDLWISVVSDIFSPDCNVAERLAVSNVVHEHDAVRSLEVRGGDGAEALLPCLGYTESGKVIRMSTKNCWSFAELSCTYRVPYLQLDHGLSHSEQLNFIVDANSSHKVCGKFFTRVLQDQT